MIVASASGTGTATSQGGLSLWTPDKDVSNCKLYFDGFDVSAQEFTYSSVANGSDFSNASWTKVDCTITADNTTAPDSTVTADKVTVSVATSPRVSSALTNHGFNATKMAPTDYVFYAKKGSGFDFVILETETVLNEAACRVAFNINTGAAGTPGSGLSAVSITDAGNGWWKCQATSNTGGTGVAGAFRIRPSLTDAFSVPAVNSFCYLWGASAIQTRIASIENKATGVIWREATAANQPGWEPTWVSGHGAIRGYGQTTSMMDVDPDTLTCLQGNDPTYTYVRVGQYRVVTAGVREFASANGNTNDAAAVFGVSASGSHYAVARDPDGGSSGLEVDSTATINTSAHVACWHSPGTTVSFQLDNGAADPSGGALDVASVTCTRSAFFCNARNTLASFSDFSMGACVMSSSDLSSSQITEIARFLAGRAGLTVS